MTENRIKLDRLLSGLELAAEQAETVEYDEETGRISSHFFVYDPTDDEQKAQTESEERIAIGRVSEVNDDGSVEVELNWESSPK